jgi:hypothetical protein
MALLSPNPKQQFFDANGDALVGGKIYTYEAGTSTPVATYVDSSGTTANTNPIILDSRGMCNIWLLSTVSYKYVVKDANDTLIFTTDNIGVTLTTASFATPPIIGNGTPNSAYFTDLYASGAVQFTGTGAALLNAGTTAQRPATPTAGMVRYNSTNGKFEGYAAGAWGSLGGGATGGGADQVFVENGQTVTTSYTITTNFNAMSVGPITIDSGAEVGIPDGSTWLIF